MTTPAVEWDEAWWEEPEEAPPAGYPFTPEDYLCAHGEWRGDRCADCEHRARREGRLHELELHRECWREEHYNPDEAAMEDLLEQGPLDIYPDVATARRPLRGHPVNHAIRVHDMEDVRAHTRLRRMTEHIREAEAGLTRVYGERTMKRAEQARNQPRNKKGQFVARRYVRPRGPDGRFMAKQPVRQGVTYNLDGWNITYPPGVTNVQWERDHMRAGYQITGSIRVPASTATTNWYAAEAPPTGAWAIAHTTTSTFVTDEQLIGTGGNVAAVYPQTWSNWTGTNNGVQQYNYVVNAQNAATTWRNWNQVTNVAINRYQETEEQERQRLIRAEERRRLEQERRDARQAQAEAASRLRLANARVIERADERAWELLEMILTTEEKLYRENNGGNIFVRAKSGRLFVIETNYAGGSVHGNVLEVDEHGCKLVRLCAAPRMYDETHELRMPMADGYVGQYLTLKHNEEEFLSRANPSQRRECQHKGVPILGAPAMVA